MMSGDELLEWTEMICGPSPRNVCREAARGVGGSHLPDDNDRLRMSGAETMTDERAVEHD